MLRHMRLDFTCEEHQYWRRLYYVTTQGIQVGIPLLFSVERAATFSVVRSKYSTPFLIIYRLYIDVCFAIIPSLDLPHLQHHSPV